MKKYIILSLLLFTCLIPAVAGDDYEAPGYYKLNKDKYSRIGTHFGFGIEISELTGSRATKKLAVGLNIAGERQINQFVAIDFANIGAKLIPADMGDYIYAHALPVGVKFYTPNYRYFRAFAGLDAGVCYTFREKKSGDYANGNFVGFGLNFNAGVYVCKNVTLGYALYWDTASEQKAHMARIGFIF